MAFIVKDKTKCKCGCEKDWYETFENHEDLVYFPKDVPYVELKDEYEDLVCFGQEKLKELFNNGSKYEQ
jgi:hypothetical protein